MPKLKPSEDELKSRMLQGIISKYMLMNQISEEALAVKMHIVKRTLQNKRKRPETFTYPEVRAAMKILKVPDEEKVQVL